MPYKDPNVGEIRSGTEIGKISYHSYMWRICKNCKNGRWQELSQRTELCGLCSRQKVGKDKLVHINMKNPKEGDVISGQLIGKRNCRHKWRVCRSCKKGKWILISSSAKHCVSCHQRENGGNNWKNGRSIQKDGYVLIYVTKNSKYYSMAKRNKNRRGRYIREHRLVMARHLHRPLCRGEIVHHRNGIKDDNAISNLKLRMRSNHGVDWGSGYRQGYKEGYQNIFMKTVRLLKALEKKSLSNTLGVEVAKT